MPPSPAPEIGDDERVAIGSVLDGRYRIDAVLGSGGMGRVYRGEHTGIGRAVAIKVLHANLDRNKEAAQRFQREALASGRLDHPNIVGVSDFGVLENGACYLVMEALEGESVGERLDRERRIPWTEAVAILRGVLAGLQHAHERGVVHRDIKPDNVFLARKDGALVVKILDFGIAKLYAGDANDPASTRAGLTVGTPAYLSPEQAVGGEIGPASDLYSATIVLFEMIAGRAPFEDKDPLAMLGAHVSRPPPRIAELAPELDVPAALEEVIQHGLAKLSADRLHSASEYLARLDAITGVPPPRGSAPITMPSVEALGAMPTATLPSAATPVPGSLHTPVPLGYATPVPGAYQPVVATSLVALPAHGGPAQLSGTSLATRRYYLIGGAIVAAAIVVAALVALSSGGGKDAGGPTMVPLPMVVGGESSVDRETRMKALLHDLQNGKTCAERKATIPQIVELDDARAIAMLAKARTRSDNACLTREAEAAIKALREAHPPPK